MAQSNQPPVFDSQTEDIQGVNVSHTIPADTTDTSNTYAQQAQVQDIDGIPAQYPPVQNQGLALSPEQLAELESRYGVTLDQITAPVTQQPQAPLPQQQPAPQQFQQPAQPQPTYTQPQPQQPQQLPQPQITQEQLNSANAAYKKAVGIDPNAVYNDLTEMRNELQQLRQERYIERQTTTLRNEWGADYDNRMEKVYSFYNNMPEANRAAMNQMSIVDAAKLVYAAVQQQEMNGQPPANTPLQVNRGHMTMPGSLPVSDKKIYTYEDIMGMNPKADDDPFYREDVRRAFVEGRIKYT